MEPLKIASISLGAVIGVAHIGILGHLISRKPVCATPMTTPKLMEAILRGFISTPSEVYFALFFLPAQCAF